MSLVKSGALPFHAVTSDDLKPPRPGDPDSPRAGRFASPDALLSPSYMALAAVDLGIRIEPAWKVSIEIGKALSGLEYDNLLVIGSGFSFHNMNAFFAPKTAEMELMNDSFTRWLNDTCSNPNLGENERTRRLVNWEKAPSARFCHPREEHLLPLHVCYGVANCACSEFFDLEIIGKKASVYLW